MSSRIPPLLEPYLALPPEASLVLLTSVLGASSNWLVLRFFHSALIGSEALSSTPREDEAKVVLVSFMRDLAFWKENAKRLGLDLDKFTAKKRFAFVDGLSGLFLPKSSSGREGEKILSDTELAPLSTEIKRTIQNLKHAEGGRNIILVIDQIDLLLAAGGDQIGAVNLGDMLMDLREVSDFSRQKLKTVEALRFIQEVHSTVLSLSADYPLVSTNQTPLERDHAALVLNIAHEADFIMSLRLLNTGTARDVSGVLRVTGGDNAEQGSQDSQRSFEEKELLYFVGGDGGVKVFERGQ